MNVKTCLNLVDIIIDEVALEGLDGITLEALWQRLAIRLTESLPFKDAFMEQIWAICIKIQDFSFFELQKPREKLIIYDRYELEYLNTDLDKEYDYKDIYQHNPIEDTKLGIRGSCTSYFTRKDISNIIKHSSLSEAESKYGQKLIIVASQTLRERALVNENIDPVLHLPLSHYCLLERIGRARALGEITIKKSSNIKEDAKTLFYIRKGLLEHGLIRKQIYYQGNTGQSYNGQNMGTLVHLTRFFNTRRPKVIVWAEHLIDYLKSKENYAAEYNEVKNELNLDYSIKKFFKINLLQKIFRTDLKVPYRSYYPNCLDKEWQCKSSSTKERILKLVTLADPSIEIGDLWRTEEIKEDSDHFILNIENQKLNVPYLKQIYEVVESKEVKGASQMELAAELGFTKLISRTLTRNLVKRKIVSTYLDDVGRQRTTKFVSKKLDSKSSLKRQFDEEISKIKEYSRSMQNEKIKDRTRNNLDNKMKIEETSQIMPKTLESISETHISCENNSNKNFQYQLFITINNIFRKYKLFKNNRYHLASFRKHKVFNFKNGNKDVDIKENDQKAINEKFSDYLKDEKIINSDYYKTIETQLIIQKPECKKKSQKVAIVGLMEDVDNTTINKKSSISYRLLHRANLVIESVKQNRIIEDTHKLMKYINAEEAKEGFDAKIDKNSLMRLLQKLAEDNFIKNIKLILRNKKQSKQKIINFICDPSIDVNDAVIQSAVEQAKLKFCMSESYSNKSNENIEKSSNCNNSVGNNKEIKVQKKVIYFRNNYIGKKYGYSPKFVRMRTMHIFLYYLIYDHPGRTVSKDLFLEKLRKDEILDDDILEDITNVYSNELNWKTFIAPLPKHRGYPLGWALMSDVHLRMPLSIFVKVINVNFDVPGLQELLDHPVKRHFLVKDIPTPIRNLLFLKRKYIFSIHEIVCRLCYIGLVQFGPQKLKEKDQVFVYLNRHTELLDTTSSAAGYHRIEDKTYPVTKFTFSSMAAVENYWYEMWNTCINTCLGGRSVVEGKDILLEDLSRKIEMIQALKVRSPEEAVECDTGYVPGDRKGAAGIDSAFFSHLKRNWNWINSTAQKDFANEVSKVGTRQLKTDKPSRLVLANKTSKALQLRKRNSPPAKSTSKAHAILKDADVDGDTKVQGKLKQQHDKNNRSGNIGFPLARTSKPSKIIRKVLPRKPKRKRVKYDEIDFSALQRMDKLRVDWEQHEDNILLVCKVAMVYLCPNPRRKLVTFTSIRDILRSYSFTSYNKTSKACQRRLLYMLKQPKTMNSVLLGVEEVKQDFYVNKRFGGLIERIKGDYKDPVEYEQRVAKIFKELVAYIARKYYNISNMEHRDPEPLPKTIQELNLYYQLKLPTRQIKSPGVSKEVHEISDIHTSTINSVIHSSMCCGRERRSWAYQLFKVYQQYPEYLLRNAMLKIRADKMVTMKKNYMCAHKKFGNCMPMSSSQYQLSSCYYYKFQTKWPYQIFSETYNILLTLLENHVAKKDGASEDGIEVRPDDGGIVAAIHDYLSTDTLDIDIEIPDQIIMLDPGLPQKHEVYQKIAVRYQAILEALSCDNSKTKNIINNTDTDKELSQLNSNVSNEGKTTSERQSLAELRSLKRRQLHSLKETNSDVSQAKKQKMNDTEDELLNEIDEKNETEFQSINDQIKFNIIDVSAEKNKVVEIDTSEISIPLVNDTHSDNGDTDKESENAVESTNLNTQIISCDRKDISHKLENEPLIVNADKNIQDSSDSVNANVNEIENNDNILTDLIPSSEASKANYIRVSDLVQRVTSEGDVFENLDIRHDDRDARTRQTRIAMLKMREELHDLTFTDNHHAHEYFVVNSFKLLYSLSTNQEDKADATVYQGMELPRKLLPIDIGLVNQVLDEVKRHAVFPKELMTYDDLKAETIRDGRFEWRDINNIYKFVKSKCEFGATLHELITDFDYLNNKLADILIFLMEKRIFLRTGIVTVRYIHHRYINPWIIHSYKILRLEKESHQAVPEGSVYVLDTNDKHKEINSVVNAANLFYDPPIKSLNNKILRKVNQNTNSISNEEKSANTQLIANDSKKRKHIENDDFQKSKMENDCESNILKDSDSKVNENIHNKRRKIEENNFEHIKKTNESCTMDFQDNSNIETDEIINMKNNERDNDNFYKRQKMNFEINENVVLESAKTDSHLPENQKDLDTAVQKTTFSVKMDTEKSDTHEKTEDANRSLESQPRFRRKRTGLLEQKEIDKAAKLLDFNTAEEIRVVIKPWIRIDGVLNRRVLDRMLGAVLCYCIEKPGISLTAVQNRFTPAIQPYHTRELIEMLVKLDCIKTMVQKAPKVTLFSKPGNLDLTGNPDLVADSDSFIIEPTTQAALRFGMFLSNRSYNFDFLSSLSEKRNI